MPPQFGDVQLVESVNNHCCITVDLDLIGGYAKFFRNGHLLGQAFTGITAPISPALAFLQVCPSSRNRQQQKQTGCCIRDAALSRSGHLT